MKKERRKRFDWNRGERFVESLREAAGYGADDTWLADLGAEAELEPAPAKAAVTAWPLPPRKQAVGEIAGAAQ